MSALEAELQIITEEIADEIHVDPDSLSMGAHDTAAQAVPVLMERMDKVCGLMDWQATLIERSKTEQEDKKYLHKKAEKDYKHGHNTAYLGFKQEDREKFGTDFKKNAKTDPEYKAMADMEVDELLNFALQKERDYLKSQHALEDAKHKYETLNNHFLSYRKSCDLLKIEFEKLGKYGSGV